MHIEIFFLAFILFVVVVVCLVFLGDYDSAGAMMNGCINKAGAIQGHAGQQKDLCLFSLFL